MSWFVTPAEVRLPLSDDHYLIVKGELNAGETQDMYAAMMNAAGDSLDPRKVGPATIAAYLLDWSVTEADGRIVSIRAQPPDVVTAALRNLKNHRYQEIMAAIQAHERQLEAARQEKKLPPGSPASGPTWPSLVAASGATNG